MAQRPRQSPAEREPASASRWSGLYPPDQVPPPYQGCAARSAHSRAARRSPVVPPLPEPAQGGRAEKSSQVQKKDFQGLHFSVARSDHPTFVRQKRRSVSAASHPSPRLVGGASRGWPEFHDPAQSSAEPRQAASYHRSPSATQRPPQFRRPGEPWCRRRASRAPPESGSGCSTLPVRPQFRPPRALPPLRWRAQCQPEEQPPPSVRALPRRAQAR